MEETTGYSIKPIILKTPLGFDYFNYDEIIMFEAEGNCSKVISFERDTPVRILQNLSFIEKNYCNERLIRCHKSYIINLTYIEKLVIRTHQLYLKNNLVVPLSKRSLKKIRKMSEIHTKIDIDRTFLRKSEPSNP